LGLLGAATPARAASAAPAPAPAPPTPAAFLAFHWGDHIFEAGPLPQEWLKKHPERQGLLSDKKAGFKCKVLFVFWAVVYRKDCQPVAFSGKKFFDEAKIADSDPEKNWIASLNRAIGKKYRLEDLKLGFWAQNGKFILGALLLLIIVASVVRRIRS
jgi:hypothetical protein